jgi:hypothetical protein
MADMDPVYKALEKVKPQASLKLLEIVDGRNGRFLSGVVFGWALPNKLGGAGQSKPLMATGADDVGKNAVAPPVEGRRHGDDDGDYQSESLDRQAF